MILLKAYCVSQICCLSMCEGIYSLVTEYAKTGWHIDETICFYVAQQMITWSATRLDR